MPSWVCLATAFFVAIVGPTHAAEPPTAQPKPIDQTVTLRAENNLLKRQLQQEKEKVDALEQKVARLERRLAGEDVANDASDATTQPATHAAAKRVIFILDCSGSMIDKFPAMKEEVAKGVSNLPPGTSFNVIAVGDEKINAFKPSPVAINNDNYALFATFIHNLTTSGTSNLIPAVTVALRQRADSIWLCTDGDFPEKPDIHTELRKLNTAKRAKINAFWVRDRHDNPMTAKFGLTMATIAASHGGVAVDHAGPLDLTKLRVKAVSDSYNPPLRKPTPPRPSGQSIFDVGND